MTTRWKAHIPTYDQLMLPLLQLAADGNVHTLRDSVDALADSMQLTADQRDSLLPSGKRTRLEDRLNWAKTYLIQAGLLRRMGWGKFQITRRGLEVLAQNPPLINRRYLMQFSEFRLVNQSSSLPDSETVLTTQMTPQDLIQMAYLGIQQDLADDLMSEIMRASPAFFERLVIDLLLAMGYGGSRKNAAQALGRSGDGGIDGIIRQDKLGLDAIYVQAKRWENPVGRPDIQGFVGSLIGAGGKKGVFITTSRFTQAAITYAESITETKIILIDGAQLTQLMMEYGVGIVAERVYTIGTIDRDYFDLSD
jgi:restriction system protein